MLENIEVVSFDMDGTLIPKSFADDFWLKRVPELYSERFDLTKEKAKEMLLEEYEEMGREDIRWYLPDHWFSKYGLQQEPRDVLEELREEYELYKDAKETIQGLHGEYELIVISNGIKMFIEVGLDDFRNYFSKLYSSVSDFGSSSKTPNVYRKVCKNLDVSPEKVVHIGDKLNNDYHPAEKAGMRSYLIDREKSQEGALKDLRELTRLL